MRSASLGTLKLSAEPSAGIVLAASLGALPVAVMGLEFAWVVVTAGAALLFLAPWLASRQVNAVVAIDHPEFRPPTIVHAARTLPVAVTVTARRAARDVLVALQPSAESAQSTAASPRLLVAAMGAGRHTNVQLPLRMVSRGSEVSMEAEILSSFPFGLFTATRRLPLGLVVTALPRLFRAPSGTQVHAFMDQLTGLSEEEVRQRPRGQGLPTTPRPARTGDTMRELNLRASVRRMAWIAVDRAQFGHQHARIELSLRAVGDTGTTASRRGQQALEAAISLAGALATFCLEEGLSVTLACVESGAPARSLCTADSPRDHWLALVDIDAHEMRCTTESRPARKAHREPAASLVLSVRPTLFIDSSGHLRAGKDSNTTVLSIDPYGRIQRDQPRMLRPRSPHRPEAAETTRIAPTGVRA